MKTAHTKITFLFILLLAPAALATENTDPFARRLGRSLEVNQSLRNQYQSEYIQAKTELQIHSTPALLRKIKDIEDKIKVLENDSEALQSFLPPGRQAQGFLVDMITQKTNAERLKQSEKAVDLLRETSQRQNSRIGTAHAEPIYRLHERALALVADKEFDRALSIYEDIVLRNPEDDEAYIIMGHTYLLTGRYEKAERAFHNAASIDPANIQEITPFYENLALQNPNDDKAFADLGYAYLIIGDFLKAQSAFKESLAINPANPSAQAGAFHTQRLMKNV